MILTVLLLFEEYSRYLIPGTYENIPFWVHVKSAVLAGVMVQYHF
jgi:hypothetical protein